MLALPESRVRECLDFWGTLQHERDRLRRISHFVEAARETNPLMVVGGGDLLYFARFEGGRLELAARAVSGLDASAQREQMRELLRADGKAFSAIFIDNRAAELLKPLGLAPDGWRVFRGISDAFGLFGNAYATSRSAKSAIEKLQRRPPPKKRLLVYLEKVGPADRTWLDAISTDAWVEGDARPKSLIELRDLLRAHPESLIVLVGHMTGDSLEMEQGSVTKGMVELLAGQSKSALITLACNSAQGGTGILGQVRAKPLLQGVARALRARTFKEFTEALASERNPIFMDVAFAEALSTVYAAADAKAKADASVERVAEHPALLMRMKFEDAGTVRPAVTIDVAAWLDDGLSQAGSGGGADPTAPLPTANVDAGMGGPDAGEPLDAGVDATEATASPQGQTGGGWPWQATAVAIVGLCGALFVFARLRR